MTINKGLSHTTLTVSIEGRLDTTTAPELEAALKESLTDVSELIIDMEKLEYISSAGLRVILSLQKIMSKQGNMVVTGVRNEIMEIFEVTGFTDVLDIR